MSQLEITYRPIAEIKRYLRNPKTHPEAQIRAIATSIREFGFTNPLLIDGEGLIAGHGRLAAAELLGMQDVPTITIAGLTPAQRRALVIADNKISELGAWDEALLMEELAAIKMEGGVKLTATGFSENELLDMLDVGPDPKTGEPTIPGQQAQAPSEFQVFDSTLATDFCCPKCGYEWSGNPKP